MCDSCTHNLLDNLIRHGHLIETGVAGLYGRSGLFEEVVARFDALVTRWGEGDGAEVIRFPPAMNREWFGKSGYLKSFPQLAGTIHAFQGQEADHADLLDHLFAGQDWTGHQKPTEVVLTPAACYPLYPVIARRGPLDAQGALVDLQSYCFRHEPSQEPTRMQLFRMREYVRLGSPEQVVEFRTRWLERGEAMMRSLGMPLQVDLAHDPFFGRGGRMLANNQRDQGLKFELLIPVNSEESPTACLSFNYHQDHFGTTWNIRTAAGEIAHTACVGFGLERVAIALFRHHGMDPAYWPDAVRRVLWG